MCKLPCMPALFRARARPKLPACLPCTRAQPHSTITPTYWAPHRSAQGVGRGFGAGEPDGDEAHRS